MDISIVIPMYNSENTILSTLNSIKNQTALHSILEVLVINDGSTDRSQKIVGKFIRNNQHVPVILINKKNGGVSSARNTGLSLAKGSWIALLDSDDEWLPNKIEMQIRIIEEMPNIDFLGGAIDDGEMKILWRKIKGLYKADVKDLCLKMFPQTSTAIFKKSIFNQIGGYDENQNYAEDGNYFLKICSRFNYYYMPIKMVVYGSGKRAFGSSGLSSNLNGMYNGTVKNIKELKHDSIIGLGFYSFLRIFYWIKYIRRVFVTKLS